MSWEDFLSPIYTLFLTIIGVVIGEVALYTYLRARERPKDIIDTAHKEDKLGFSVSVRRKMIKDAGVRM